MTVGVVEVGAMVVEVIRKTEDEVVVGVSALGVVVVKAANKVVNFSNTSLLNEWAGLDFIVDTFGMIVGKVVNESSSSLI